MKILEPHKRIIKPDFVMFDFDGTISKLRCGWEEVMRDYMLACIPGDPQEAAALAERYIDESAGIQTIAQMRWLAGQVRERGGKALDPWDYKDAFNARLMERVLERKALLQSGDADAETYLVPGSRSFLAALRAQNIPLFLASGTDDADVRSEAEALQVDGFFDEIAGAPHRADGCAKEATLRRLLHPDEKMLIVGDGKVEIRLGREVGAVTLGVASWDRFENLTASLSPIKENRLTQAGAHALTADYTDTERILNWL